jgi:MFS family permease
MNEELSFTPLVYSTGASMFFLSYLILHVPASLLAHRIGARKGLSLMLAAWGIVSSCMAFVWSPAVFYSVRVCLGAAESGFYPAVTLYLTLWHASSAMGVNFAIITASTTLAGVIGGPLAIALMSAMDGVLGWAGWRWMYVLEAIPAVMYIAPLAHASLHKHALMKVTLTLFPHAERAAACVSSRWPPRSPPQPMANSSSAPSCSVAHCTGCDSKRRNPPRWSSGRSPGHQAAVHRSDYSAQVFGVELRLSSMVLTLLRAGFA